MAWNDGKANGAEPVSTAVGPFTGCESLKFAPTIRRARTEPGDGPHWLLGRSKGSADQRRKDSRQPI